MAEKKATTELKQESRVYIIPLRNEWRKVANYRRTGRAIKFIKQFIARHMKVPDRDVSKVKLDLYLNNEIFFRGRKKPPAKLKVRAFKENDLIRVELAEVPAHVKFLKAKQSKIHKEAEKPKAPVSPQTAPATPVETAVEEKKDDLTTPQRDAPQRSEEARSKSGDERNKEKTPEEKKEEKEKSKAAADQKSDIAKTQAKVQKHSGRAKETPIHRMALKK